jgi:hypothetical protein
MKIHILEINDPAILGNRAPGWFWFILDSNWKIKKNQRQLRVYRGCHLQRTISEPCGSTGVRRRPATH